MEKNKLTGGGFQFMAGSSAHTSAERQSEDYYATDPIAGKYLLKIEKISHKIWECACGEGHLSNVFQEKGHFVKSTDLVYRNFGTGGVDFLCFDGKWDGDIVTNPPYTLAQKFIEKALSVVDDGAKVCMFLRLQFLEGKARKKLFEKYPPVRVHVSSSRIKCPKNGDFENYKVAPPIAYAWFVWEKGYKGETTLKFFN